MTLLKPTLLVTRLVIKRSQHVVFDERFHAGVNIIRGENGSGKTTVVESIIYALGGDIRKKKDEFSLCDFVYIELQLNGVTYTFKRPIEDGYPALDIFEGSYDEAMVGPDLWTRYAHRRTNNQKSYSEIIFSLLGFPEEKTESDGNVTINDILRLLYEDQNTSANKIFLSPNFPEGNNKRQAISDLLLGIDDFQLHKLKLQLAEKDKLYSQYEGQLKQIYRIFGSSEMDVNINAILLEKKNLENEQKTIATKIDTLYAADGKAATKEAKKLFTEVKNQLTDLKKQVFSLEQERDTLVFDIEDSKEFIESLNIRLDALNASTEVTKELGSIDFSYCPCCLQVLSDTVDAKKCDLCKSDIKDDGRSLGYLKMRNEIAFQKKESENILSRKEARLSAVEILIQKSKAAQTQMERKHSNFINSLNPIEAEIKNYISRLGYIERAIQDTLEKEKLGQKIEEIKQIKAGLNAEISKLKDDIEAANALREKNRSAIYTAINDLTLQLIKNDPSKELAGVDRISFDFGKDDVVAVGKDSPAASTGTYLKNSFFFALFLVSLANRFVRYPRFILMDNIEDSGLETNRVQQFHRDIIEHSEASNTVHQIIFTARSEVITPDLDQSGLCIGKHYRRKTGEYSLNFSPVK